MVRPPILKGGQMLVIRYAVVAEMPGDRIPLDFLCEHSVIMSLI